MILMLAFSLFVAAGREDASPRMKKEDTYGVSDVHDGALCENGVDLFDVFEEIHDMLFLHVTRRMHR